MSPSAPRPTWKRTSILLGSHDYGGGAWYFITICSAGKRPCFGTLDADGVRRSSIGDLIAQRWSELPHHFPDAHFADMVVMPDHMHGLIRIRPLTSRPLHADGPRRFGPLPRRSFSLIINLLKGGVTRRARELGLIAPNARLWHRGYHDRIIRDTRHLANARAYIRNNPIRAMESDRDGTGAPEARPSDRAPRGTRMESESDRDGTGAPEARPSDRARRGTRMGSESDRDGTGAPEARPSDRAPRDPDGIGIGSGWDGRA